MKKLKNSTVLYTVKFFNSLSVRFFNFFFLLSGLNPQSKHNFRIMGNKYELIEIKVGVLRHLMVSHGFVTHTALFDR